MSELEAILSVEGAMLERIAAVYARPGAEREDLRQNIALALVQAWPRFRKESSARTFAARVAHNCGLQFLVRRRDVTEPDVVAAVTDRGPGPAERLLIREEGERLAAAIRCLPVRLRQVLSLWLEDLSSREIGDTLGLTENAVNVRLHRARQALRERLSEEDER